MANFKLHLIMLKCIKKLINDYLFRGYHGDLNETFFVGTPKEHAKKLVKNTWECLQKAIAEVKPGVKFRDVGNVIQKHAQSEGFSVVRSYCGHGKKS